MHQSFLHPLLYAALLLCHVALSHAQIFQGNFDLLKIKTNGRSLPLTETQDTDSFNLHRLSVSDTTGESLYSFQFAMGNIISGTILVNESDGRVLSVSPMVATRQRTGEDERSLEIAMMDILRNLKVLKLKDTRVIMRGPQGAIVLKHQIICILPGC